MRRRLSLPTALLALAALAGGAANAQAEIGVAPSRPFVPRQVVYKFEGQGVGRAITLPPGTRVSETLTALRANPRVVYAEPNYIATISATQPEIPFEVPNDPGTLGDEAEAATAAGNWAAKQWNLLPWQASSIPGLPTSPGGIDAVGAWQNLARFGNPGAAGVTVAVVDTGIAYPATAGTFLTNKFPPSPDFGESRFAAGYDYVDLDRFPLDQNGHGTHVAGTIGEQTNNGVGLAGLAYRSTLMPVRVLDENGRGDAVRIAQGIRFAVAHGADVINMSFNFACGKQVPLVDEALRRAYVAGVVTVASAGNLGSEDCVSEPATGPRVIAVGGTTEGGCIGDYSLAGSQVDLVAPGGGEPVSGCPSVLSRPIFQVTLQPGRTDAFWIPGDYTGTSMAAAHVSGVAAMLLSIGRRPPGTHLLPRLSHIVNAVTGRLRKTARKIGPPSTLQGAGLLDAGRATKRQPFLR
jgi:serine protease